MWPEGPGHWRAYWDPWSETGIRWEWANDVLLPADWDPNAPSEYDGKWTETITLTHEAVEFDNFVVPAFEGDLERLAWERARA